MKRLTLLLLTLTLLSCGEDTYTVHGTLEEQALVMEVADLFEDNGLPRPGCDVYFEDDPIPGKCGWCWRGSQRVVVDRTCVHQVYITIHELLHCVGFDHGPGMTLLENALLEKYYEGV